MAEETIITATEASRAFSDILHRVCYGGESFVIKKGSRFMARIAPVVEALLEDSASAIMAESDNIKNTIIEKSENTESFAVEEAEVPIIASDESEFYHAWMEQVRKVEA